MRCDAKTFVLLCIILPVCLCTGSYARESYIRVDSTVKGKARVFIRPSGEGQYREVAGEIPARIPLPDNKNYEVMMVKYDKFFFRYVGEKKDVHSPEEITITTHRELVWGRVILVAFIPLLGVLEYSRRMRIKREQELEDTLKEAEERAEEAELRAERSTMGIRIPEKIGKYEILEKIGEGGMAAVYKVKDSSGDIFALKVPHQRFLDNEEFMKRFAHEAKIGQSLNNPRIVRIYDYNLLTGTGLPFILLEFLEGQTLTEIRKKRGALEPGTALRYVREIALALEYAHSHHVIHRDIKPANVVITNKDQVKIMDFGVAKASDLTELTVTDTALGTPKYMAPEQIDSKAADIRADLYALGMIFYELLTGRLPYEDEDPYRIVIKKLTTPPVPPRNYNPTVPEEAEQIILRLIRKEPDERYQTASEVLTDLEKLGVSLQKDELKAEMTGDA